MRIIVYINTMSFTIFPPLWARRSITRQRKPRCFALVREGGLKRPAPTTTKFIRFHWLFLDGKTFVYACYRLRNRLSALRQGRHKLVPVAAQCRVFRPLCRLFSEIIAGYNKPGIKIGHGRDLPAKAYQVRQPSFTRCHIPDTSSIRQVKTSVQDGAHK